MEAKGEGDEADRRFLGLFDERRWRLRTDTIQIQAIHTIYMCQTTRAKSALSEPVRITAVASPSLLQVVFPFPFRPTRNPTYLRKYGSEYRHD